MNNWHQRNEGRGGEGGGKEGGEEDVWEIWGEEEMDADYGGMVQPNQQHV